jgi:hypothetical protein
MSIDVSYPHIEKLDAEPARLRRVPRLRVAQLAMDYLAHGWSPDEICRQYPYLQLAEAHAAMGYYYDHQEEIDGEIRDELAQIEADRAGASPSPFLVRMRVKGLR